ncbi:hypothetical protein RSAG8_09047, partial [Rhizoctonia solani AG-8 WAC10335]
MIGFVSTAFLALASVANALPKGRISVLTTGNQVKKRRGREAHELDQHSSCDLQQLLGLERVYPVCCQRYVVTTHYEPI